MTIGAWTALALCAASGDHTAAFGPADDVREPASAVVFGPILAASPDGDLRAVIVGSHANAEIARTTHALIAREGALVEWVRLPFEEIPDAALAPDAHAIHCIFRDAGASGEIATLDPRGAVVERVGLRDVLPVGGVPDADSRLGVGYSVNGPCLSIPLECGSVAMLEYSAALPSPFGVCSLLRPEKFECGADAWLEQARKLQRKGDLAAARYAFEAAIETDPADARTYREFARFHVKQGDAAARLACLRTGVDRLYRRANGPVTGDWSVGTPSARLVVDFLDATREANGDKACHVALDEALELYPCMEHIVLMRAKLLLDEGEDEAAIWTLDNALALVDPNNDLAAAFHDVGRFLRGEDRDALALRYMEDAHALGDRSEFLLRGLAEIAADAGEFARATEWLGELRSIWADTQNGETQERRSARAAERLAGLDQEIADLEALAVAAAPED